MRVRNIGTIEAWRGEPLVIDLGKTIDGTLTAWATKKDKPHKEFVVIDGRYLKLDADQTSDGPQGKVAGVWKFDVRRSPDGIESPSIIYKGSIEFINQITGSDSVDRFA